MRSISRLTMTALATGGLALLSAFPAPAAVIGTGSEPVDDTFSVGSCTAPDGTVYDLVEHDLGTSSFRDKFRGPASRFSYDQVWFGSGADDVVSTYTNVQTGLSWSGHAVSQSKDQRILAVHGNLQTYLRGVNSHFEVIAPDGSVAARQDVRVEFTVQIDTQGTADPADDTDTFLELTKQAGRDTVRDFCVDALDYTVPAS